MNLATATTLITAINDARLDAHTRNLDSLRDKVVAMLEAAAHTTYADVLADTATVEEFRIGCARVAAAIYQQFYATA